MIDPKTFKIGDTLYYIEPDGYRGRYDCRVIVGETSQSWIVLSVGYPEWMRRPDILARYGKKVPKHGKGYTFGTVYDMRLAHWALTNKHSIGQCIEALYDQPEKLLQIAKLINYEPLPELEAKIG